MGLSIAGKVQKAHGTIDTPTMAARGLGFVLAGAASFVIAASLIGGSGGIDEGRDLTPASSINTSLSSAAVTSSKFHTIQQPESLTGCQPDLLDEATVALLEGFGICLP